MDAPGSGQSRMAPPRRAFPVGGEGPAAGAADGGLGAGANGPGLPPAGSRPADPGPPPMTSSGLVRRHPKSESPFPELDGPPAGLAGPSGSGADEDTESANRPMYSWNPSDTTEAFPKVLPPGESHPG